MLKYSTIILHSRNNKFIISVQQKDRGITNMLNLDKITMPTSAVETQKLIQQEKLQCNICFC